MSLLMDALKKAELAKRQAPKDQTEPSILSSPREALALTPLKNTAEPFAGEQSIPPSTVEYEEAKLGSLPKLSSTLELLDQEFMDEALVLAQRKPDSTQVSKPGRVGTYPPPPSTSAAPPLGTSPPQRTPGETQRERESVQNLFAAKQAPASSRKTLAIVGVLSMFVVAAIGIYFWLQLQPKSSLMPSRGAVLPMMTPTHPMVPAPALPVVEPVTNIPATPAAASPHKAQSSEPTIAPARLPAPPPEIPIRVTTSKLEVDPTVDAAFNALQNGDLGGAKAAYEKSLKNDPKNADALHGLAAIQLRQGKPDLAQDYYLRALEADPKDALAQANLISMSGQIDPVQSESRLKLLLSAQPESSFLNFYIGNLYARQNRWAEAQQGYFKAMAGEPDNPDYLFNLAVSLDQLHQAKLAAQYYGQALTAADKRPAGFDKQQVSDRLKKLQP